MLLYLTAPKFYFFTMNRLQACLFLRMIPGLGNVSSKKLWEFSTSPEAIFDRSPEDFLSLEGIGKVLIDHLKGWRKYADAVYKEEEKINKHQIKPIFLGDPAYPKTLSFCPDAPLVLFSKGNFSFTQRRLISIVGTRSCDAHGEKLCRELIQGLQGVNPMIVSGFARGIDIIAHHQAIKSKLPTLACMAHGLNQIYPPEHQAYVAEMEADGGFVSEFMLDEKFDRKHFLIRNRIIAGLSHATVVIQSKIRGGSMITANFAHQYNRELFAFPGQVGKAVHGGCHQLIRSQKAQLITGADDLIQAMGWTPTPQPQGVQKKLFVTLEDEEKVIFDCLKSVAQESLDNIALSTGFSISKTATLLFKLEMKGCVKPLPGKLFEWI
ncbi:MAG: DNA processing protein DprA [Flavobacteriaceae bacterium]|nr:MAG: DNA processing protein DprA [Flavobacteriaceae bacterium]